MELKMNIQPVSFSRQFYDYEKDMNTSYQKKNRIMNDSFEYTSTLKHAEKERFNRLNQIAVNFYTPAFVNINNANKAVPHELELIKNIRDFITTQKENTSVVLTDDDIQAKLSVNDDGAILNRNNQDLYLSVKENNNEQKRLCAYYYNEENKSGAAIELNETGKIISLKSAGFCNLLDIKEMIENFVDIASENENVNFDVNTVKKVLENIE